MTAVDLEAHASPFLATTHPRARSLNQKWLAALAAVASSYSGSFGCNPDLCAATFGRPVREAPLETACSLAEAAKRCSRDSPVLTAEIALDAHTV